MAMAKAKGKAAGATSTTPTLTKRTTAARRTAARQVKKKAPGQKNHVEGVASPPSIIGKKIATSGAARKGIQRKGADESKAPPALPRGWPASSNFSYPVPRGASEVGGGGATAKDGANTVADARDVDVERELSKSKSPPSPPPAADVASYLRPGSLLQTSCNGSDVFLRKRAVQSTSMAFPSAAQGEDGNMTVVNKGGPSRLLIVFPGRLSLNAPPPPLAKDGVSGDDGDENGENELRGEEEKDRDKKRDKDGGEEGKPATRRNPFAPTHPPQLLGNLVSLCGEERRMELRIPFPDTSTTEATCGGPSDGQKHKNLVMSGRAVPLAGKFMALSFKRTGGKVSASAGKMSKNKKMGTGSIICKDIFRSIIVFGESKLMTSGGKATDLAEKSKVFSMDTKNEEGKSRSDVDNDQNHHGPKMKHYGGSERTLDGGGKTGASPGGKAICKGGSVGTDSAPHKGFAPSVDVCSESDNTTMDDADEDEYDSDSQSDEDFVPLATKRRKGGASKEKTKNQVADVGVEAIALTRKHTPRRSAASMVKVSYVDEDSDFDMVKIDSNDEEDVRSTCSDDEPEDGVVDAEPKIQNVEQKDASSAGKKLSNGKMPHGKDIIEKSTSVLRGKGADSNPEEEESNESSKFSFEEEDYELPKGNKGKPKANEPSAKPVANAKKKSSTKSARKRNASKKSEKKKNDMERGDRTCGGHGHSKENGKGDLRQMTKSMKPAENKVNLEESDSEGKVDVEVPIPKKRTSRRKAAKVADLCYIDEDSNVDMENNCSNMDEEVKQKTEAKGKKATPKPAKTNATSPGSEAASKKRKNDEIGDNKSIEVADEEHKEPKKSKVEVTKKSNKGSGKDFKSQKGNRIARPVTKGSTKVSVKDGVKGSLSRTKSPSKKKPSSDDGGDRGFGSRRKKEVTKMPPKKTIAAILSSPISPLSLKDSPTTKSPISRGGKRKKNSPIRGRASPKKSGKENELNLDDDPYAFL